LKGWSRSAADRMIPSQKTLYEGWVGTKALLPSSTGYCIA